MSTCTCHGQELLLAARIPGLRGIEMNPREYVTKCECGVGEAVSGHLHDSVREVRVRVWVVV
jgi:hypothetical protein